MQVSFIIPLYNCLPYTEAMIASLQATLPAGLTHEIILVDDGSTDGTREWLATLREPFRVVLNAQNLGYAKSNNRGAALARGEFLALLNNDLVLSPHWLPPLFALQHRLGSRAGMIGNVQRNARTGAVDHTGIFINHQGKPEHDRTLPWWCWLPGGGSRTAVAVTGACVLVRRDLWQELGGFDERYVNGCEDVDFCLRTAATGRINAVALRSVVQHHVSSSPGRKARDEENTWKLTQRWRERIVPLATHDWCRHYLETLPTGDPAENDQGLTRDAALYWHHLARQPTPRLLSAVSTSIDVEMERWEKMFGK
jgi:GT2 family glycosyltransferase